MQALKLTPKQKEVFDAVLKATTENKIDVSKLGLVKESA
jgi:hypothetical protein